MASDTDRTTAIIKISERRDALFEDFDHVLHEVMFAMSGTHYQFPNGSVFEERSARYLPTTSGTVTVTVSVRVDMPDAERAASEMLDRMEEGGDDE